MQAGGLSRADEGVEPRELLPRRLSPVAGDAVVAAPFVVAVAGRGARRLLDQALVEQPLQRRVQRARVQPRRGSGRAHVAQDGVTVAVAAREGQQDLELDFSQPGHYTCNRYTCVKAGRRVAAGGVTWGSIGAPPARPRRRRDGLTAAGDLYIVYRQYTITPVPILRVDLASPTPVYRQICDGLRLLLVAGTPAPGDRLPTVRQLATDLNVHHNTVAEAYRMLADEGWIDLRRGRGARVLKRRPPKDTADAGQARAEFLQRTRELTALAISRGVSRKALARDLGSLAGDVLED